MELAGYRRYQDMLVEAKETLEAIVCDDKNLKTEYAFSPELAALILANRKFKRMIAGEEVPKDRGEALDIEKIYWQFCESCLDENECEENAEWYWSLVVAERKGEVYRKAAADLSAIAMLLYPERYLGNDRIGIESWPQNLLDPYWMAKTICDCDRGIKEHPEIAQMLSEIVEKEYGEGTWSEMMRRYLRLFAPEAGLGFSFLE